MTKIKQRGWRAAAMNLLALLALLAGVEIILRLAGPPAPEPIERPRISSLFRPEKIGDRIVMVNNYTANLEPDGIPFNLEPVGIRVDQNLSAADRQKIKDMLQPVMSFPQEKKPGTRRVFILGSSPVWGSIGGLDEQHSLFAYYLYQVLRERDPQTPYEIVNAAHIGFGVPEVLASLTEVLRYQPDLLVVYFGGVMPMVEPPAEREDLKRPPATARALGWLRQLRLVRLLTGRPDAPPAPGGEENPVPAFGPDSKPLEQPLVYDAEIVNMIENLNQQTAEDFRQFFLTVAETTAEHQVPVLLYTVATNTADFPPFWSVHTRPIGQAERLRFADLLDRGREAHARNDLPAAEQLLAAAVKLGPTFAAAHYELGQVCRQMGRRQEAQTAFAAAKEFDMSNERMLDRPNRLLAEIAAQFGLTVIDTEILLRSWPESDGYLGNDLFLDHQHFQPFVLQRLAADLAARLPDSLRQPETANRN